MREGDIAEVVIWDDKEGRVTRKVVKYRILKVYPYFVLCQHCKAGYLECFRPGQLQEPRAAGWKD